MCSVKFTILFNTLKNLICLKRKGYRGLMSRNSTNEVKMPKELEERIKIVFGNINDICEWHKT
jgi:hypothetical protein